MTKADLQCLVCCCRAFLPGREPLDGDDGKGYYELLGVDERASTEEIRKAYRKRSLEYHPDKIAQRRGTPNEVNVQDFQRIKEAYETLMNPRRRDIYDVMGHRAMPYVTNPSSIEAQTVADNLARSTFCDRFKVVSGVCALVGVLLIQPILVCLKVDRRDGELFDDVDWLPLFVPTWFLNTLILLFLISAVLASKKHERKERAERGDGDAAVHNTHANSSLPTTADHAATFIKFVCIVAAEITLVLKFDGELTVPYYVVFVPLYAYEIVRAVHAVRTIKYENDRVDRMVTMRVVEEELGRPYADFSEDERDDANERYIIVHTPPTSPDAVMRDESLKDLADEMDVVRSPEFQQSRRRVGNAYGELSSVFFHAVFLGLLIPRLDDDDVGWNWWLVFLPIWIRFFLLCARDCYSICFHAPALPEEERMMGDDDDVDVDVDVDADVGRDGEDDVEEEDGEEYYEGTKSDNNGTVAADGPTSKTNVGPDKTVTYDTFNDDKIRDDRVTAAAAAADKESTTNRSPLSVEVGDGGVGGGGNNDDPELGLNEDDVYESFAEEGEDTSSAVEATLRAIASCCSTFFYIVVTCLFVGKLQGDSYSSFWVIFPILLPVGLVLCSFTCGICCFRDADVLKQMNGQAVDTAECVPKEEDTFSSTSFLQEFEDAKAPDGHGHAKQDDNANFLPRMESNGQESDMDELD